MSAKSSQICWCLGIVCIVYGREGLVCSEAVKGSGALSGLKSGCKVQKK